MPLVGTDAIVKGRSGLIYCGDVARTDQQQLSDFKSNRPVLTDLPQNLETVLPAHAVEFRVTHFRIGLVRRGANDIGSSNRSIKHYFRAKGVAINLCVLRFGIGEFNTLIS